MRGYLGKATWVGATLAVLLVFPAAAGCGKHKPAGAVGANNQISVFCNEPRRGRVAETIRQIFAYPVEVVGKQDAFRLDFVPFRDFRIHQYVKNQIFVVNLSRGDDLAKALPRLLGKAGKERLRARKPFFFLAQDAWATGQTSFFAAAWSEEDLYRLLAQADSTRLRRDYENSVVRGLTLTMFSLGERKDLPAQVARKYGWTMRLLEDFYGSEDPEGNFVKFNSNEPVRLVLVHWVNEELPLRPAVWKPILDRILKKYNDGDSVFAERTRTFPEPFQGRPALRWEGVWQNEKYVIGGPFRAVAFHRGGRSFLLVGQVYNPGGDKVHLLRQVEALMATFRIVD